MDRSSVDWHGNLCAVVTPFTESGEIDRQAFEENIRLLDSEGVTGFVIAGCTGEFWSLDEGERLDLFAWARAATDKRVIGNASAIRTSASIRYATAALDRGLDGIMLTPPYYVKPSPDEVVAHYTKVSDAVSIPILMYSIPSRQAVDPSISLIERLADVDNVVAFKQSTSDFQVVLDTFRAVGDRILMLPGHSVDRGYPCLVMGADGYVSSVESQVLGRDAIRMYDLFVAGDHEAARSVQLRCIELDKAIHGPVGTFPASLKAAMNLCGRPGGFPREPLHAASRIQREALAKTLEAIGAPLRQPV